MKLRSLQCTRMFLRISECRHLDGMRYGGRYVTRFSAPRQSKTISTLPSRVGCILFTLNSKRWIAMRPRSSPWYAFATARLSENNPVTQPWPFPHSRTKAAEHRWGNNSLMYDPSVTATRDPSRIECCIHSVPPDTDIFSRSHVFPHDSSTSRNIDGVGLTSVVQAVERSRQYSPSRVGCTEHTVLSCWRFWLWD